MQFDRGRPQTQAALEPRRLWHGTFAGELHFALLETAGIILHIAAATGMDGHVKRQRWLGTLVLAAVLLLTQTLLLMHEHEHDSQEPDESCEICLHLSFLKHTSPSDNLPPPPWAAGLSSDEVFAPRSLRPAVVCFDARAPPAASPL